MKKNTGPTPGQSYSVLALCPSLSAGGSERNAVNLMRHLPHFGINLQLGLYVKRGSLFDCVPNCSVITEFGDGIHKTFDRLSEELQFYAFRMARIVEQTNPDLVLTLLPFASLAWKTALNLKLSPSRPWIALDGHNPLQWIEDEITTEFQKDSQQLIREAYLSADRVVSASAELRTAILDTYGLSKQKVVHIYNPVEVREIQKACARGLRDRPSVPVIMTAARLVRQKGIDTLLHAFRIVCHHIDARLVILGTGPLREDLQALANKLGISEKVEFRGFHPEPWLLFAEADYYVLASRWEGFGHTLVEAMATGVPVIATNCDFGPREIISDCTGILVEPENESHIASALLKLFNDADLRASLVERGYARARDFDTSIILPSFVKLIREVLEVSPSCRNNKL